MREGVRLADVRHPIQVSAELPTEPAMPPSRGGMCEPPGPDPRPDVAEFSAFGSQFFLDVRTRAGDVAQVPLVSMPDMVMSSDGPADFGGLRFRVLSLSGYEGEELRMRWELRGHVFEGDTRTAYHSRLNYREREPDGYADGRPYWF
jgi:hypothetical protein